MLYNHECKSKFIYSNRIFVILVLFFSFGLLSSCDDNITAQTENKPQTIVEKYGQLSISGASLIDKQGEIVVLRGMSLFWSQWGGIYYNKETIQWLRDDWKCTIIRAAMGVEYGGYLENSGQEFQKLRTVIEACIDLGIYVIVDWHDHHGENHLQESKSFFNSISSMYGDYPNVIYEIYNEPLNISWNEVLKPYSETIINEIRKNDPDNVIIVGTPNWSQDVDDVIGNRIADKNVAYSFHFYTGTHREELRIKAQQAIMNNVPLFISEWGISEANGNGKIDMAETIIWQEFIEQENLSNCNWSVVNKDETSAILLPTTVTLSNWRLNELSKAGIIIRDYLIGKNSELFNFENIE